MSAAACFALSMTLKDDKRVDAEAYQLAKSEPIQTEFAYQISDAITPRATAPNPIDLNHANEVADKAVATPAFQEAFALAWPKVYNQLVRGDQGDVVLDSALVNQAIADSGSAPVPDLVLRVNRSDIPDLRKPVEVIGKLAGGLAAIAMLLIGFGIGMSTRRNRAFMRIGRWMITTGIVTIVVFWALPTLALVPLGGWVGVFGIVLATGDWLVVPAAVLAGLGLTVLLMARAGETETRRRDLAVIPQPVGRSTHRPTTS